MLPKLFNIYLFLVCFSLFFSFAETVSITQKYYDVAKNYLPGYAGHYSDHDQIVVLMKNYESGGLEGQSATPTRTQILDIINSQFIGKRPNITGEFSTLAVLDDIRILSVTYDYLELYEWKEQIEQEFFVSRESKGSLGTDIINNKIQVGFETANFQMFEIISKELNDFLKENSIPNEAIDIVKVEFSFATTRPTPAPTPDDDKNANSYSRPVMMNLEIQANDRYTNETGVCSIGFFVKKGRSYGFVTNHHCIGWEHDLNQPLSSYPFKWGQDS